MIGVDKEKIQVLMKKSDAAIVKELAKKDTRTISKMAYILIMKGLEVVREE